MKLPTKIELQTQLKQVNKKQLLDIGMILSIVFTTLFSIYFFYSFSEYKTNLDANKLVIATKEKELNALNSFSTQKADLQDKYLSLISAIPADFEVPQMLNQIIELTRSIGVKPSTLSYGSGGAESEGLSKVIVQTTISGPYDRLIKYLQEVERARRLTDSSEFAIAAGTNDEQTLTIRVTGYHMKEVKKTTIGEFANESLNSSTLTNALATIESFIDYPFVVDLTRGIGRSNPFEGLPNADSKVQTGAGTIKDTKGLIDVQLPPQSPISQDSTNSSTQIPTSEIRTKTFINSADSHSFVVPVSWDGSSLSPGVSTLSATDGSSKSIIVVRKVGLTTDFASFIVTEKSKATSTLQNFTIKEDNIVQVGAITGHELGGEFQSADGSGRTLKFLVPIDATTVYVIEAQSKLEDWNLEVDRVRQILLSFKPL